MPLTLDVIERRQDDGTEIVHRVEPVVFRDPQFGRLRLRAHGRHAIHVADPR